MGMENLGDLLNEIKATREALDRGDDVTTRRITALETTINDLFKRLGRPGLSNSDGDYDFERKSAIDYCRTRKHLTTPKIAADVTPDYMPTAAEIDEAIVARKALRSLIRHGDVKRLDHLEMKSLSSFNFGSNGFILAPEMSSRVLSCLTDETDIAGLMANMTISGPSVKFLIDNVLIDYAAWACETSCFANNPQPDLIQGLGELELKPESLRYILCVTRDLVEDASINLEAWMMSKVNRAFRRTVSTAIMTGDGIGKPLGILHPSAGIQTCDVSERTAAGQISWQDIVALKWQVPAQYHGGGRYLMNQNTAGYLMTLSDASGRPIMIPMPLGTSGTTVSPGTMSLNGSPVQIVTQMPDVAAGSVPIAYGNWNETYMVVNRKAATMQVDPYSAGFCILYKWEARIGGGIICPNAARLLRVK